MNILLLGKTGQVGFELHRTLPLLGPIIAPGREELDLMNPQAVTNFLEHHQPDIIVNAAAWTDVDGAVSQIDKAHRMNADLPRQLALFCIEQGAVLVHYSTDYVYPGHGTEPWQETSATGPVNAYGQSKLEGDRAIQQSGAEHFIFRTSWVYSARGNNFMKTMLRLAQSNTELNIVADQVGAPTPARLIANITSLALNSNIPGGLYHLAPNGETSWCDFAKAIFSLARQTSEQFTRGPENIRPIPGSDYPTAAKRPQNSRLALTKLETALNIRLPDWQSQLELTLGEYLR